MRFPVVFSLLNAEVKKTHCARLPRIIAVLALAGALVACSAVKTIYSQAPDLAYWYLDGYVDFNGTQSLQVKAGLNKVQAWHRQTQLPAYIDILQKLQERLPSNITAIEACEVAADVRVKLIAVSSQMEPTAVAVATTISTSQLQQMEKKFAKSNAEYREDFLEGTPQQKRSKRLKKAVKRAEMLYGDLQEDQVAAIAQSIDRSRFNPALAFSEWQRRQQDVLQTVRSVSGSLPASPAHTNAEKIRAAIRGLIERSSESPDAGYRNYLKSLTEQSCQSFADFHNKTTPAQRNKAVETLKNYEQDFRSLSGASGSTAARMNAALGIMG
jgi:Family of unknown function (DUF6279)